MNTAEKPNHFVTDNKLAEITGLTVKAIAKYRERDDVTCPELYFMAANGRVMWDLEAFLEWLAGSRYTKAGSEFRSNGKGKGSTKQPSSKPQLQV